MSKASEVLKMLAGSLKKKSNINLISLGDPNCGAIVKNRIPTSSRFLNSILGGGVPCGRLTEIFGAESNGKSSLGADIIAQTQAMGGIAVLIDSEQVFEPGRAENMGINVPEVMWSEEPSVEGAFNIIDAALPALRDAKVPSVIVWDSVAASQPLKILEEGVDKQTMAEKARLLSRGLARIISKVGPHTALIFINQERTKIGAMPFSKPTEATGGFALRYYSSVRIELTSMGQVKEGEKPIGIRVRAMTRKNKTHPPFKKAEYEIYFAGGLSDHDALLDLLVKSGAVKLTGSWYNYGKKKFQSKDFAQHIQFLEGEIEKALGAL